MNTNGDYDVESALAKLVRVSPTLHDCYHAIVADWSPETPPLTIVFAALGRCISSQRGAVSRDEAKMIWECVEELLVSGNEKVKNGVATGFVEAVLGDVSAGRLKADTFASLIGRETAKYCKAWNEFTGCVIEELDCPPS